MRDINPSGYPGAPEHRSIRAIPVSGKRPPHEHHEYVDEPPRRRRRRGGRFWLLLVVVLALFALAGALLSTVFAGATVTVHPRQVEVDAPPTVEARLSAPVGTLEYRTISATSEASVTVTAQGTQQVSRQASGIITISNTFSVEPQRLIANTRFESSDGKIYRIRDSVTVPGMAGGKAGSMTATIYADSPGASYNKNGATTFTIPGFKGDPKFEKITATSQGEIAGGFVGQEAAVAPADLQKAKEDLQRKLDSDARAAVSQSVPEGYGILPGVLSVTYSAVAQKPADSGKVTLSQSATAVGAIVSGRDLGSAIARVQVPNYKGEAVELIPDNLEVNASSTAEGVLTIAMKGKLTLVWQFDPNAVRQALIGKPKGEFQTILKSFAPAIECKSESPCDARIRPFWASTFPGNQEKITIKTQ